MVSLLCAIKYCPVAHLRIRCRSPDGSHMHRRLSNANHILGLKYVLPLLLGALVIDQYIYRCSLWSTLHRKRCCSTFSEHESPVVRSIALQVLVLLVRPAVSKT